MKGHLFAKIMLGLTLFAGMGLYGHLVGASSAEATPISRSVEQWKTLEIELISERNYPNPFLDVTLTATFLGPDGEVITRPGFWDGDNVWKVRFAPTATGTWHYYIASNDDANTGLRESGVINSTDYTGDLAIYEHGFVRLSDDNRYFTYADGTPFFWMGDTHWFFGGKERLESANKAGWSSQFKGMVDRRIEQQFNVYQSVIFGPDTLYWEDNQVGTLIDPDVFRDNIDQKMAYIADAGLVNAFGIGFHSNIDNFTEGSERLAQYIVARYGSYPIVWISGGEGPGYNRELRDAREEGWRAVGRQFHRYDAYDHPQTSHSPAVTEKNRFGLPQFYEGEGWFDFELLQGGHQKFVEADDYYYYWDTYQLPFMESEANYEQIFDGWATEAIVRQSAYRSIQAGGFGFTYGAHGIWNAAYDDHDTQDDYGYGHENWYDAIDFPGGYQMTHLLQYYQDIPWYTLVYRPIGWANWDGVFDAEASQPVLSADEQSNVISVYFAPDTSSDGQLIALKDTAYTARWFNPRNGSYLLIDDRIIPNNGQWSVPEKPDAQDWLLLVEKVVPDALSTILRDVRTSLIDANTTAISSTGTSASNAIDGDKTTAWEAIDDSMGQWLRLDLGAARELTEIELWLEDSDECQTIEAAVDGCADRWKYDIQGSVDGVNWFTLIDRSTVAVFGNHQRERVSGTVRFIQLNVAEARDRAKVAEIDVFGKISQAAAIRSNKYIVDEKLQIIDHVPAREPVATFLQHAKPTLNGSVHIFEQDGLTPVTAGQMKSDMKVVIHSASGTSTKTYRVQTIEDNIALRSTATASSVESSFYSPQYVIDGNKDTVTWRGWATNQLPAWVELQLDAPQTINKTTIYMKKGYEQTEYAFQYWDADEEAWIDAFHRVTDNTLDSRTHLFPEVTTEKIRLYMTQGNVLQNGEGPGQKIARINEIELYYAEDNAVSRITVQGQDDLSIIDTPLGALQMVATIEPLDATYQDVQWKVTTEADQPTELAQISTTGLLTALGDGIVKVSAHSTDGSGTWGETLVTLNNQPPPVVPVLASDGKGVTASSSIGGHRPPSAITDGNPDTGWIADGATFPQWFIIDLESVHELMEVSQQFFNDDQWKYVIEGSLDATNWLELVDASDNHLFISEKTHKVSGEARYVKMTITGAKAVYPNYASSKQFMVYVKPTPPEVPVSLNKSATASSTNGGSIATRATDDDLDTAWVASGAAFPQWLQVDLEDVYEIDKIEQRFANEDQ